ncbi:helix-turn-helix domain-containing protein [Ramlibacter sp. MAHUQ-53]|uniref:helix-turn-helix domain-containing protein n=1 Tax=unclassified Ramlibacter TaxID=2617605 RepID=UPI003628B523
MNFGQRLKTLRKAKGLTLERLGKALGPGGEDVSKQAVSNWESGRYVPTLDLVPEICARLGCSADYLLMGREMAVNLSPDVTRVALLAEQLSPEIRAKMLPMWEEMVAMFKSQTVPNPRTNNSNSKKTQAGN